MPGKKCIHIVVVSVNIHSETHEPRTQTWHVCVSFLPAYLWFIALHSFLRSKLLNKFRYNWKYETNYLSIYLLARPKEMIIWTIWSFLDIFMKIYKYWIYYNWNQATMKILQTKFCPHFIWINILIIYDQYILPLWMERHTLNKKNNIYQPLKFQ